MAEKKLTRGTKELIKKAIAETNSLDRYVLCANIANTVVKKYSGMNLDYQLDRMGLTTTGQILEAIDIYIEIYHRDSLPEKPLDLSLF